MFNIYKFYSNDLEIFLSIIIISLIIIFFYDKIKFHGKLTIELLKMKIITLSKNNFLDSNDSDNKKGYELDFILEVCNNQNSYNNVYDLEIIRKKINIENSYLNLKDTMKSLSGTTSYEKLKYFNLYPYEIRTYHIIIKLTKDEFENIKQYPIYLKYKSKGHLKKIKLNKYLKDKK